MMELKHYGIVGMHYGTRRYRNYDGRLTDAGKARYNYKDGKQVKNILKKYHDFAIIEKQNQQTQLDMMKEKIDYAEKARPSFTTPSNKEFYDASKKAEQARKEQKASKKNTSVKNVSKAIESGKNVVSKYLRVVVAASKKGSSGKRLVK